MFRQRKQNDSPYEGKFIFHAHKDTAEWIRHRLDDYREECCPLPVISQAPVIPEETGRCRPRRFCSHGLPDSPGSCRASRDPFQDTSFGKIPPEIRLQIFEYTLAVSPALLKDDLSVPMIRDYSISAQGEQIQNLEQESRPPSCLALLSTCRQIYKESYGIFYSSNTLFLGNAHDLLAFLTSIGPVRRKHIVSLHLACLTTEVPAWTNELIDYAIGNPEEIGFPTYLEADRERLLSQTKSVAAPSAELARSLLADCVRLHKLYLNISLRDEAPHFKWLTELPKTKGNVIRFADAFHWKLTEVSRQKYWSGGWYDDFCCDQIINRDDPEVYVDLNPNRLSFGSVQRFEVDIMSPPEIIFADEGE